ncbi:cobalamin B12-binding domain-containing protein [Cypionkella sinensis]|uniref:B12-binding domain-containing protein n=1 Tax=Cypionkella sinensis TaxID=1756043 RepID=A0ABV7IXX6_9RHOB
MSRSATFDRHMLEVAFSEIEVVQKALPPATLTTLAAEVVSRVANNLRVETVPDLQPDADDIDALCNALLADDPREAAAFIERAQLRGSSYESLCLLYLSVAAQRLGEWWETDEVSFYRVTVAAGRIYAILRILRRERPIGTPSLLRAATFASVPGENHTLGITIASDLARERGWDIELFVGLNHDALVEKLEQRQPMLIGLSASGKRSLPALTRLIVALRIHNPGARILVCGQIATSNLTLVGVTGADAAAADFDSALAHMERLLNLPTNRLPI